MDTLHTDTEENLTPEDYTQIRDGLRRGVEDENTGRTKSLADVVAEARAKHGFPASWPFGASDQAPTPSVGGMSGPAAALHE